MSTKKKQEVLQATGQDSPDMQAFRERMHKEGLMRDLINTISGLCTQQFFTVQALVEMCELQEATTNAVNKLIDEIRIGNDNSEAIKFSAAFISENVNSIALDSCSIARGNSDINVQNTIHLDDEAAEQIERIADNLSTQGGISIADNLDMIRSDIDTVIDDQSDDRVKVHLDGEVANYPQPY